MYLGVQRLLVCAASSGRGLARCSVVIVGQGPWVGHCRGRCWAVAGPGRVPLARSGLVVAGAGCVGSQCFGSAGPDWFVAWSQGICIRRPAALGRICSFIPVPGAGSYGVWRGRRLHTGDSMCWRWWAVARRRVWTVGWPWSGTRVLELGFGVCCWAWGWSGRAEGKCSAHGVRNMGGGWAVGGLVFRTWVFGSATGCGGGR